MPFPTVAGWRENQPATTPDGVWSRIWQKENTCSTWGSCRRAGGIRQNWKPCSNGEDGRKPKADRRVSDRTFWLTILILAGLYVYSWQRK